MRHHSRTLALAVFAAALAAAPTAGAHESDGHSAAGGGMSKKVKKELARARDATERYKDVDRATAAGYKPASPCVSQEGLGGMGFHYVKPALMGTPKVEARKPEALLFAPGKGGKLKLVGVEYQKVDADGDVATDGDRPRLFGQDFDGPVAPRFPGDAAHYELHVWLHKKNPSGIFAPFNPNVRC